MANRLLPFVAAICGLVSVVHGRGVDTVDLPGRVFTEGKGVPNAVVWLEAPRAPRIPHTVLMDQRNLSFDPGVLVTSVGSTVVFPNNDRVLHNVFSFRDGKQFDLGLYPVGKAKRVTFDRPGVSRLFCNIHPGMVAYVVVVDSPYFALTDQDGRFVLRDVPAGSHTYRVWRPTGPEASSTVVAAAGAQLEVPWPAR